MPRRVLTSSRGFRVLNVYGNFTSLKRKTGICALCLHTTWMKTQVCFTHCITLGSRRSLWARKTPITLFTLFSWRSNQANQTRMSLNKTEENIVKTQNIYRKCALQTQKLELSHVSTVASQQLSQTQIILKAYSLLLVSLLHFEIIFKLWLLIQWKRSKCNIVLTGTDIEITIPVGTNFILTFTFRCYKHIIVLHICFRM